MRGPDFELPPLEPPAAPEDPPDQIRRRSPGRRAVALATLLALLGSAAFALYSAVGTSPSPPAAVDEPVVTEEPLPRRSSTTRVTPTTPARTVFRTCLDSPENAGAAHGAPPSTPSWLTFHFGPRVATEALVMIAEAAAAAHDALGDAGALEIHVHCDVDEMAAATGQTPDEIRKNIDDGLVASILSRRIRIYGPAFERRPAVDRRQAVHHEYFHGVQQQLSRSRSARSDLVTPLWLLEGSAEFFESAVTQADLNAFRRQQVRRWRDLPALEALESSGGAQVTGGSGAAYVLGSVASDYLVTRYGRDLLQSGYWKALSTTDWRTAFSQVFGVTVDTFYAEFEAYRITLRP